VERWKTKWNVVAVSFNGRHVASVVSRQHRRHSVVKWIVAELLRRVYYWSSSFLQCSRSLFHRPVTGVSTVTSVSTVAAGSVGRSLVLLLRHVSIIINILTTASVTVCDSLCHILPYCCCCWIHPLQCSGNCSSHFLMNGDNKIWRNLFVVCKNCFV